MIGLGTLINASMIVAGGLIGLFGGKLLKEQYRTMLTQAVGLAVIFVGISGSLSKILTYDGSTRGTMMLIASLCIGGLIGQWTGINEKMESFGEWLKQKSGSAKDAQFVNAFVTASLTVCIGAMAIVGAIQDGLTGDYSILALKGVMDFIIVMVMAASLGKGAIFSAVPVFLVQGCVTLLAHAISGLISDAALADLSLVGNVLIFAVGVNLLKPKTFNVANLLPAVLIPFIWHLF